MSTISPQLVCSDSPTNMTFPHSNFSDPYLSAPTADPDQDDFKSSGIRLTPEPTQQDLRELPVSPFNQDGNNDHGADTASFQTTGYTTSYSDFLSPVDDLSSNLSAHASINGDLTATGAVNTELHPEFSGWQQEIISSRILHAPLDGQLDTMEASGLTQPQLLTPDRSNNPSPDSVCTNSREQIDSSDTRIPAHTLSVVTAPLKNTLTVSPAPEATRVTSPIVMVDYYSRGDSPVRETFVTARRPSQSSTHLSPGGGSEDGEAENTWQTSPHPIPRADDGSWLRNGTTGQAGVGPAARDDTYIFSPNEVESQRRLEEKNSDIRAWSASVSVASENGDEPIHPRGRKIPIGNRRRARSAGDPAPQQDYFNLQFATQQPELPGPGALLHVSSDDGLSDNESDTDVSRTESPAASIHEARWADEDLASSPSHGQHRIEDKEPAAHQFLATRPWQDPVHDSTPRSAQMQPPTSNAAIVEYQRRAREMDELSRYATWGTRPISEVDANSIIGAGGSLAKMSPSKNSSQKHTRRSSLRKFFERKPSIGGLKRPLSELTISQPNIQSPTQEESIKVPPQRKDSFPPRKLSLVRAPKSPVLSTGGAVIAIAGQMAAIGGRDQLSAVSPHATSSPWTRLNRARSRSEITRTPAPGLIDLMTSHGGPPVPNIAYSRAIASESQGIQQVVSRPQHDTREDDDDDDDDDIAEEKGLMMEFPVLTRLPVPTMEGFKTQISQLNPRLQPALIERLANEQVRRYKKLVENKANHARAVGKNKCSAGKFCFSQGGEAAMLPPRSAANDSDGAHTQFQITGHDGASEEPSALGENAVTAAQFPQGVPLPPVKRLPAEFECSICFKVKKFQKPSDWTKHIHEDVQPFTCTFPHCNEPKSFKRKADWVRHENERHRKLEWWTCNVPDCHHTCYRKDNFVQHLVREHKMLEPKTKKAKSKSRGANGRQDANVSGEESLWDLVDKCHHDTPKKPKEEPCRFCGNVCSSWKKLTVHLAKHMEQIAMPVLTLVQERELSSSSSADTGPTPKAVSYPGSVAKKVAAFVPSLEGVKAGSDMSIGFTQAPCNSSEVQRPGRFGPLHPTYPPASTTLQGEFLSAEPESIIDSTMSSPYGSRGDLPGQLGVNQSQFMPMHQNSVSYPPLFHAGPRSRLFAQDLSVLQNPYHYSTSPTEMHATYDPQGTVHMSPSSVENDYTYQGPIGPATSYSYDPSVGYAHQL